MRNKDQNGGGKIFIAMVSPKYSTMGYVSNVSYGEGALACTLLQGLGLTAVYGDACGTPTPTQYATAAMSDFFGQTQSFSLSANPSTLSIAPGSTGTSTIAVTDNDGFNGQVTLGASGLPSGVTAQLESQSDNHNQHAGADGRQRRCSRNLHHHYQRRLRQLDQSNDDIANGGGKWADRESFTDVSDISKNRCGATSKSKTVTLTNTGASTLNIPGLPAQMFAIQEPDLHRFTLAPKAKCTVKVTFTPTQVGTRTGTLSFTDNAPGSPQTVALSGTGIAQATLTPASETYSNQKVGTTSKAKKFTLTNNQAVELTGIAISTTGDFAVSAQTCGSSLAAKKKCTIDVTFTPTQTGRGWDN